MKKIIFSVFLVLPFAFCYGQNISNLDARNGFKDFHFGDPKSKWSSLLEVDKDETYGIFYLYKGSCCNSFFNMKLSEVKIGFDQLNKLNCIMMVGNDTILKFIADVFINNIIKEFGEPTDYDTVLQNVGLIGYTWKGKTVTLNVFLLSLHNNGFYIASAVIEPTDSLKDY